MFVKMKVEILLFAMMPVAAWAARFAPPQVPPPEFADMEASTNIAFSAGAAKDRRWTLSFELDAADVNNAQIEFGTDCDCDGALGLEECELAIGWDCGEWILCDRRGGETRRSAEEPGRNRLEWTLYLDEERRPHTLRGNVFDGGAQTTYFNPGWNMARLVVRGTNAANEIVRSAISANPFSVSIQ